MHDKNWFSKNEDTLQIIKDAVPESECILEIGAFDGVDEGFYEYKRFDLYSGIHGESYFLKK